MTDLLVRSGTVVLPGVSAVRADAAISDGRIVAIVPEHAEADLRGGEPGPLHDRHRANPFAGRRLRARVVRTLLRGRTVFAGGRVAPEARGRLTIPEGGDR